MPYFNKFSMTLNTDCFKQFLDFRFSQIISVFQMGLQLENNTESTFIQRHHVEYMSCQCTLPGSLCFICLIIYSFF